LTGRTEIRGSGSNGKMLLWKTRSGERERERERKSQLKGWWKRRESES